GGAAPRMRPVALDEAEQPPEEQPAPDRDHQPGGDREREEDDPVGHGVERRYRPGRKRAEGHVPSNRLARWRLRRPDASARRRSSPRSGRHTIAMPASSPSGKTRAGGGSSSRASRPD